MRGYAPEGPAGLRDDEDWADALSAGVEFFCRNFLLTLTAVNFLGCGATGVVTGFNWTSVGWDAVAGLAVVDSTAGWADDCAVLAGVGASLVAPASGDDEETEMSSVSEVSGAEPREAEAPPCPLSSFSSESATTGSWLSILAIDASQDAVVCGNPRVWGTSSGKILDVRGTTRAASAKDNCSSGSTATSTHLQERPPRMDTSKRCEFNRRICICLLQTTPAQPTRPRAGSVYLSLCLTRRSPSLSAKHSKSTPSTVFPAMSAGTPAVSAEQAYYGS